MPRLIGNAGARRLHYHPALTKSMPDLAHLVRLASALPKPGDEQEQELVAVIGWLTEPDRSCLDRRQRQAGWNYLVAHGLAHMDARMLASSAQAVAWKTPFSEVLFAGWRMKNMANSQDLVKDVAANLKLTKFIRSELASSCWSVFLRRSSLTRLIRSRVRLLQTPP